MQRDTISHTTDTGILRSWFFLVFFGGITLDLLTKYFAVVSPWFGYHAIIGDFLVIKYIRNEGIAFSLPLTGVLLQILTIGLIIGIFWWYVRERKKYSLPFFDIVCACILAGAVGNGLERIFIGSVTDFISVKYFAIFNFADMMITCGAILLAFYTFFYGNTHSGR